MTWGSSATRLIGLALAVLVGVPLLGTVSLAVAPAAAHADSVSGDSVPGDSVPGDSVAGDTAPTATEPASADPTEAESPDFASEAYGDPWDYSNRADQNTDASSTHGISVSRGKLRLHVAGGDWFSPVTSQPDALSNGRDGNAIPVDTKRYDHLSFEMTQPSDGTGAIYWFTCGGLVARCAGGLSFDVLAGTHVYDLDLTSPSTIAAKVPWSGSRLVGVRMIPFRSTSPTARVDATINWMRLYDPARPHAAYPPGVHGGVTITRRPIAVVDSPNTTEGVDVTASQHRRPWVFTKAANAAGVTVKNATVKSFGAQGMTATNSKPTRNDPQLLLPISKFAGGKYRYLSFDLRYDGPFDLADAPGGGKMARLIWGVSGTKRLQESNDIVTYGGTNAGPITVDLAKGDPLDENSRSPRLGWAGRTVTSLRFDPNEDPGANTWHLTSLHLRAAPAATKTTVIRFHDAAWVDGTTATIRVGRSTAGTIRWTTVAAGKSVSQGANSHRWNLGSLPSGAYRVEVRLKHPDGSTDTATSSAPITMSR